MRRTFPRWWLVGSAVPTVTQSMSAAPYSSSSEKGRVGDLERRDDQRAIERALDRPSWVSVSGLYGRRAGLSAAGGYLAQATEINGIFRILPDFVGFGSILRRPAVGTAK